MAFSIYILPSANADFASDEANSNADLSLSSLSTSLIPFPPPPPDALSIIG